MGSVGNPAEISSPTSPVRDRRRHVRHKVHLPAYASQSAISALDLSEIVDLSEDGMAIQTSSRLAVAQRTAFLLDFSETGASLKVEGRVIWTNPAGRAGIQFAEMPSESLFAVKKWLFANAIAAHVNRAAEARVAAEAQRLTSPPKMNLAVSPALEEFEAPTRPDYTSILSALAAVKKEVEALGNDLDGALHLIARRAQAFTKATGAAVALTEGQDMICRATAGPDAPDVGARLRIGSGFSGECVRTGALLRCDDAETDSRVDRESCRALGIRSMVAVPIRWNAAIIGLLEVFSPQAMAFGRNDETVLTRLAEMVSVSVQRAGTPQPDVRQEAGSVDDEFPVETAAELPLPELVRSRNTLLIAAAATIVFVIAWLIGTWDFSSKRNTDRPGQTKSVSPPAPTPTVSTVEGLRALAEKGDATSQFALGVRYHTGEDVPQDYAEAFRWFSMAAEHGNVPAQATLAAYYWEGRGVTQDWVKAYYWSVLAEAGGDEASKQRAALLASRLNRNQILAAQQQANDWLREHQGSKDSPAQ